MNDFPAAFLIGKLSNRIRRRITEMASDLPYTGAQGKVLHYLLAQKENVYQKDIEENFSLRPSSATEVLKKMEDAGLLYRVPEEKDARLKRIILTEKGLSFKDVVMDGLDNVEADISRGIKPKDIETFKKVCAKMIDNIEP